MVTRTVSTRESTQEPSHGHNDATTDLDTIRHWWEKWPNANIGIPTDGSGLVVIDVDPRNGGDWTLRRLEEQDGGLPHTPTVMTGDGRHIWLRHNGVPVRSTTHGLGPGVDIKGAGGYVVAPPSRHENGQRYEWITDGPRRRAVVPDWVIQILAAKRVKGRRSTPPQATGNQPTPNLTSILRGVPEGQRDETIFRYACSLRAKGLSKDEARTLISEGYKSLDRGTHPFSLDDALEKVDAAYDRYPEGGTRSNPRNRSAASELVDIATEQSELFHDHGEAFASIDFDDHRETYPVRSPGFKSWLLAKFWEMYQKAPSSQSQHDALAVLEAKARFEGEERTVSLRVAERANGAIYVDLGDPFWRAVKITATGWTIVVRPSVRFWRPKGYEALPLPDRGGTLDELRAFLNVSDEDFLLVLAVLVGAFRTGTPQVVFAPSGEQGSAKSTLCRILKALVDPHEVPLRRPPRNTEALMVATRHSYLLVFDNMSSIPDWLSDDLCAVATGTGFGTRQLYTNDEEATLKARRPMVLNGIEELGTRGDLLDRMIPITLPAISDRDRRTEKEFWEAFHSVAPRILGTLFDAVACALNNVASVELDNRIRMADFCEWVVAAAPALGYAEEDVLKALTRTRHRLTAAALEASSLVEPLRRLLEEDRHGQFIGNATRLLEGLEAHMPDGVPPKDWPANARALGNQLRRLTPDLRRAGVSVIWIPNGRKWKIWSEGMEDEGRRRA